MKKKNYSERYRQITDDLLGILDEIEQQLFEINQLTLFPIDCCDNAGEVLKSMGNTVLRLKSLNKQLCSSKNRFRSGKQKKLQSITFEQAKRLIKAGFDWTVPSYYSVPTVALALKWMRDEKKAIYLIGSNGEEVVFCGEISGIDCRGVSFKTFEAAESNLLDEFLTLLEKGFEQSNG